MGYLDYDRRRGTLFPAQLNIPVNAFETDPVLNKRSTSYGRTSLSPSTPNNVGLITVPNSQTIMVIHQIHLFLHTICTYDGATVRPLIILNQTIVFCSSITLGGALQVHRFHRDRTYPAISFHSS